jgi:hypothetical protein
MLPRRGAQQNCGGEGQAKGRRARSEWALSPSLSLSLSLMRVSPSVCPPAIPASTILLPSRHGCGKGHAVYP